MHGTRPKCLEPGFGDSQYRCRLLPRHTNRFLARIENLPMTQLPPLSPEEKEQVLQTIEMFGVIVQASPNDAQSLEILRDAYVRVGR